MKTTIQVELVGLPVPSTVGVKAFPSMPAPQTVPPPSWTLFEVPLDELSPEALESLCADFRRAVFSKAGKSFLPEPAREINKPRAALDHLKSILCNSEGTVWVTEAGDETSAIKRALQELDASLAAL